MALLFADGFDHYSTSEIDDKWDNRSSTSSNVINSGTGQNSSDNWRQTSGNYLELYIPETSTLIFGFWIHFTTQSTSTTNLITLLNGTTEEFALEYTNGKLAIEGNGTDKGWANYYMSANEEHYIECKVTINDSVGSVELRADGNTILTRSNIDTGNQLINRFRLGQISGLLGTVDWDDFYLLDDSGTSFNDFLGPIHIETLLPNGVGTNSAWTVLTGPSNYQDVDENPPDGDTTYVSTSTVSNKDSYDFANLSMTAGTIHTVQVNHYARNAGIGTRTIDTAIESNVTSTTSGNTNTPSGSYKFLRDSIEQDPDAAAAWTVSTFNAAEFGPNLVS
jgi:hypothetical protein